MPKGISQAEVRLNSEKIKFVALAVIELCLSEGISQAVSQSENSIKLKFSRNFLKEFWINLIGLTFI